MFNFFKKNKKVGVVENATFDIELVAYALAYEVAIADGDIDDNELKRIKSGLLRISDKLSQSSNELFQIIEEHNRNSVSFYEFVEDINKGYTKNEKLSLLEFMWKIAYADGNLDVDEERLIRRLADMIKIKDMEVLKLKNISKN